MGVQLVAKGTLVYMDLKRPRANKQNPEAEPKYSVSVAVDDKFVAEAKKAVFKVLLEKCGGDKAAATREVKQVQANADKLFLRDGDLAKLEFLHGKKYIVAKNTKQPTFFGGEPKGKGLVPVDVFYRGCVVQAVIDVYAFADGVHAGLMGVQFYAHGEKLGGDGGTPQATGDMFPDIEVTVDSSATVEEEGFEVGDEETDEVPW